MKALLLISLLLLVGCSSSQKARRYLHRADKLIKKAEALGVTVRQDTIWADRTTIIPGDSIKIKIPYFKDTVIYKDRMILKTYHKHDTISIIAECLPDTVRINVPITVHKSIICPDCPKDRMWKGIGFGAGGLLILLILFALTRLIK